MATSKPGAKVFVLDTNVLVHDPEAIHNFNDNVVVVPYVVLVELDRMKANSNGRGFAARSVSRFIRGLLEKHGSLENGVLLETGGQLFVSRDAVSLQSLPIKGLKQTSDNQIIATAKWWQNREDKGSQRSVILVTKDSYMAITANVCRLMVEDYTSDHVKDKAALSYTGHQTVEDVDNRVFDSLFSEDGLDVKDLSLGADTYVHMGFVLRNAHRSALGRLYPDGRIRRIHNRTVSNITPRNAEQTLVLDILCDPNIPLITISGKAGTGKTLMALAAAVEQRAAYRQIFLARPIVPLSNQDMGFLPGEIGAKLDPFMQPLYDNLAVIGAGHKQKKATHRQGSKEDRGEPQDSGEDGRSSGLIRQMMDNEKIIVAALPYIRGRSLNGIFFIVDEAQNLTPHEVKTIVTRAGRGTKIVFTGDIFQIDHPYLDVRSNGLSYLIEKMRGEDLYAHIALEKGERSQLAELASNLL